MKYIHKPPTDFEHLNNLKLREAFWIGIYKPSNFVNIDKIENLDLVFYLIEQYDENEEIIESFLYDNELEYFEDINILGL